MLIKKTDATVATVPHGNADNMLVSLKELAQRWGADRNTVRRLLRQAGIHPVILGDGRNGTIRYVEGEVQAWLKTRERAV